MSASKTNYFQGIVSLLKEMSKIFIDLSNRVDKVEEEQQLIVESLKMIKDQQQEIVKQHLTVFQQVKQIGDLQSQIAKQIVQQHEETEQLYKALGLKKDLSYYSYNLHNEEGH